jgi:hypothetical protein
MRLQVRNPKNLYAGLLFGSFGIIGHTAGWSYPMGTAFRMGPGYFPLVINSALMLLSLVIIGTSFFGKVEPAPKLHLRPLIFVLGGVVLFALLIIPLGLVIAATSLIVISRLGGWDIRFQQTVLLCLGLTIGAVLVFIYGLGLPFSVWPN